MYIVSRVHNGSIVHQTRHSSVIIITITAYHCSTFIRLSLHVTVGILFSPIKYAIPIPISSPKLPPLPWEWEFPFPCTPLLRNLCYRTDTVVFSHTRVFCL